MPLYVHLAWDGGIFAIRETGEQLWVDRKGLDEELGAAKDQIVAHELPIKLLEEPHPHAVVAPEERRTIIRE